MGRVDLKSLERAVAALERPTWAMRIVNLIGLPLEAAINLLFVNTFQRAAGGHFIVRRLERKYGADVVRRAYEASAGR